MGGMAEAEAPEQRNMKLPKCMFFAKSVFPRIQATMLHFRQPTWMMSMFLGHFFECCDHSANLMVSEMAVWTSESFGKCNQYLKSIRAPGKKSPLEKTIVGSVLHLLGSLDVPFVLQQAGQITCNAIHSNSSGIENESCACEAMTVEIAMSATIFSMYLCLCFFNYFI